MEHLSNDHEDHPSQHENSHMSNAMKRGILFSLFQMKIIATVTKNSHQDRCPRYIHLWFFSFTHTLLYVIIMSRTSFRVNTLFYSAAKYKIVAIAVFLSKLDQRPLFIDIYYETILVRELVSIWITNVTYCL